MGRSYFISEIYSTYFALVLEFLHLKLSCGSNFDSYRSGH